MASQNHRAWTEVVEVSRQEMCRRPVINPELYSFYEEVLRRLEQTNEKQALRFRFANAETAAHYRKYMSAKIRHRYGKGMVHTCVRAQRAPDGTGAYVYMSRGEQWGGG